MLTGTYEENEKQLRRLAKYCQSHDKFTDSMLQRVLQADYFLSCVTETFETRQLRDTFRGTIDKCQKQRLLTLNKHELRPELGFIENKEYLTDLVKRCEVTNFHSDSFKQEVLQAKYYVGRLVEETSDILLKEKLQDIDDAFRVVLSLDIIKEDTEDDGSELVHNLFRTVKLSSTFLLFWYMLTHIDDIIHFVDRLTLGVLKLVLGVY